MSIRAFFIAAPASGQGKTTLTAALARALARQGMRVRVFKTGPDYLDPQILSLASDAPVLQLDLWMAGADYCRQMLYQASLEADVIIVEGVMGLFDGEPSGADLAAAFGLPVVLAMDVSGMAQTTGALVQGLANHREDIQIAGVIANYCGSDYHARLVAESLPKEIPLLFSLARDKAMTLPERHLGLVQAFEAEKEILQRLDTAADRLAELDLKSIIQQLPEVGFSAAVLPELPKALTAKTIAIARDGAFSFIYRDNENCLRQMGANLVYFSPLADSQIPDCDAIWLPGGYPELYADQLAANSEMKTALYQHWQAGTKILAECGGFLYCLNGLTQLDGSRREMLGLIAGEGRMAERGGCQGMQTAVFPEGEIRGHAHHRSKAEVDLQAYSFGRRQRHPAPGEPIYIQGSLRASYLHLFFRNNPEAVAALLS